MARTRPKTRPSRSPFSSPARNWSAEARPPMSRALVDHLAGAVRRAALVEKPFVHLQLDGIFPADVYAAMLAAMPSAGDYRAMSGRSKSARRDDGTPTRV